MNRNLLAVAASFLLFAFVSHAANLRPGNQQSALVETHDQLESKGYTKSACHTGVLGYRFPADGSPAFEDWSSSGLNCVYGNKASCRVRYIELKLKTKDNTNRYLTVDSSGTLVLTSTVSTVRLVFRGERSSGVRVAFLNANNGVTQSSTGGFTWLFPRCSGGNTIDFTGTDFGTSCEYLVYDTAGNPYKYTAGGNGFYNTITENGATHYISFDVISTSSPANVDGSSVTIFTT